MKAEKVIERRDNKMPLPKTLPPAVEIPYMPETIGDIAKILKVFIHDFRLFRLYQRIKLDHSKIIPAPPCIF